jgi:MFS family permease
MCAPVPLPGASPCGESLLNYLVVNALVPVPAEGHAVEALAALSAAAVALTSALFPVAYGAAAGRSGGRRRRSSCSGDSSFLHNARSLAACLCAALVGLFDVALAAACSARAPAGALRATACSNNSIGESSCGDVSCQYECFSYV